ncbi:MAG: hypothetical protein V4773_14925 [Verrucomicrobiota bacterium]
MQPKTRRPRRRIVDRLLIAAVVYLGLWAGTWLYAPGALRRQIYKEAEPAWRAERRRLEDERKRGNRRTRDLPIYEHGPVARVQLMVCPAPFVIQAECGRSIAGLNGHGWIGWYFVTPWRVYLFAKTPTWIS